LLCVVDDPLAFIPSSRPARYMFAFGGKQSLMRADNINHHSIGATYLLRVLEVSAAVSVRAVCRSVLKPLPPLVGMQGTTQLHPELFLESRASDQISSCLPRGPMTNVAQPKPCVASQSKSSAPRSGSLDGHLLVWGLLEVSVGTQPRPDLYQRSGLPRSAIMISAFELPALTVYSCLHNSAESRLRFMTNQAIKPSRNRL
jgi:hypothetical protein